VTAGRVSANETEQASALRRFVPIVGNGDVFCHASARALMDATSCDAVMVSRGALGNPWVFTEILAERSVSPTLAEWLEVVLEHVALHETHYGGGRTAAVLMRKHLLWYAKGFPGVKSLRDAFNVIEDLNVARDLLRGYAAKHAPSTLRFAGSDGRAQGAAAVGDTETKHDPKFEMDRELDRGVGHLDMADQG
jgi:tRNA-dihydrouridine synthase B